MSKLSNLHSVLEAVDFDVRSSEKFHWECYERAIFIDVKTPGYGLPVSIVVNLKDDVIYEIQWDEDEDERFLYVHPDYLVAYKEEHSARNIDLPEITTTDISEAIDWLKNN